MSAKTFKCPIASYCCIQYWHSETQYLHVKKNKYMIRDRPGIFYSLSTMPSYHAPTIILILFHVQKTHYEAP